MPGLGPRSRLLFVGVPFAPSVVGQREWLARGDGLLAFDPAVGKAVRERPLPAGLLGLASDGRFLYVLRQDQVQVVEPPPPPGRPGKGKR